MTQKKSGEASPPPAPKRKMRPGGGKQKGNSFENTVAKKLSAALDPLKFIRTQGSGARVGGKNFETIGQMFGADALKLFVGDVVPVNEREAGVRFKYSIECKAYKTPDSFTSLVSGTANVFKWIQESEHDAVKVGRIPLLIFKWNMTPVYVVSGRGVIDAQPALSIEGHGRVLDIFYLDELLSKPNLWYSIQ